MPITPRKVRIVQALVVQDPTTKNLIVPTAAQIYNSDKTTVSTIYSDVTGTSLSNPVPTGVTIGNAGLDTAGNLDIWVDIGQDYYVLVNSVFIPLSTTAVHHADLTDHLGITGAISDPHGSQAYADLHKVDKTTLGVAGGTATLDSTGCIPATQWVFD